MFSDFANGGIMWTGQGPRECRHDVAFDEAFSAVPVMTVTVSMWDMDQKTKLRADIAADLVTPQGFNLVFKTWGDSRIARVRVDWMAIGPIRDADDWDIG